MGWAGWQPYTRLDLTDDKKKSADGGWMEERYQRQMFLKSKVLTSTDKVQKIVRVGHNFFNMMKFLKRIVLDSQELASYQSLNT